MLRGVESKVDCRSICWRVVYRSIWVFCSKEIRCLSLCMELVYSVRGIKVSTCLRRMSSWVWWVHLLFHISPALSESPIDVSPRSPCIMKIIQRWAGESGVCRRMRKIEIDTKKINVSRSIRAGWEHAGLICVWVVAEVLHRGAASRHNYACISSPFCQVCFVCHSAVV